MSKTLFSLLFLAVGLLLSGCGNSDPAGLAEEVPEGRNVIQEGETDLNGTDENSGDREFVLPEEVDLSDGVSEEEVILIVEKKAIEVYGEEQIDEQRPFVIVDDTNGVEDIYLARGSLGENKLGGVVEVKISTWSGAVSNITHGK